MKAKLTEIEQVELNQEDLTEFKVEADGAAGRGFSAEMYNPREFYIESSGRDGTGHLYGRAQLKKIIPKLTRMLATAERMLKNE